MFENEFGDLVDDGIISAIDLKERLEKGKEKLLKEMEEKKDISMFEFSHYWGMIHCIDYLLEEVLKGDTSWIEKYKDA